MTGESGLAGDCMLMTNSGNTVELQRRIALYDDEAAYRQLFFHFYQPLVRFARTLLGGIESAEEIVSDVFLKVWEKRKTLDTVQNLRLYLYVSTRNTTLNYLSKQRKMQVISLDDLSVDFPSHTLDPEQLMITAEMMRRIAEAVNSLPPRCKMVFRLIREDALPYKEVAEILDISIKTIDNHLAIAVRRISQAIGLKLKDKVA